MKVEYDKEAKAMYIELADIPDGGVDHTEGFFADFVFIDKNEFGQIVGIEVLGVDAIEALEEVKEYHQDPPKTGDTLYGVPIEVK